MLFFLKKCQWLQVTSQLFDVSTCISIVAMIFTVTANSLLLVGIVRSRGYKSKFYSIITSIAVADLLTGTIISPYSVYLTHRYSKLKTLEIEDVQTDVLFHTLFFTVAGAAILSSAFMSVDRYIFLKNPEIYTSSLNIQKHIVAIFSIWIFSLFCSLVQHLIGFMLFLLLFSTIIVALSGIIMSAILISYWRHFQKEENDVIIHKLPTDSKTSFKDSLPTLNLPAGSDECYPGRASPTIINHLHAIRTEIRKPSDTPSVATIPGTTDDITSDITNAPIRSSITALETGDRSKKKRSLLGRGLYESRIVLTLTLITAVYWLHYLPFIVSSYYLFFCNTCSCKSPLVLQNVVLYTAMFSSGVRSLIFMLRLSQAKEAVCNLFDRRRKRRLNYTMERDTRSPR